MHNTFKNKQNTQYTLSTPNPPSSTPFTSIKQTPPFLSHYHSHLHLHPKFPSSDPPSSLKLSEIDKS